MPGRRALGAMPQCIPDLEYETQSSDIPPAMAESTQYGLIDMMDLLITNTGSVGPLAFDAEHHFKGK